MDAKRKVIITLIILVILVFGSYVSTKWISKTTGMAIFEGKSEISKCLSGKAILYGLESCSYCQIQKKELGSGMKDIEYIDCEKDIELCKGIKEIPAWRINGSLYYGMKSVDELKTLSGC